MDDQPWNYVDKSPRFSSEVAKKYLQEQSLRSSQGRSLGEDYYEYTPYAHDERVGEFNSQHRLVGGIIERFVQSYLKPFFEVFHSFLNLIHKSKYWHFLHVSPSSISKYFELKYINHISNLNSFFFFAAQGYG